MPTYTKYRVGGDLMVREPYWYTKLVDGNSITMWSMHKDLQSWSIHSTKGVPLSVVELVETPLAKVLAYFIQFQAPILPVHIIFVCGFGHQNQ